VLKERIDYPQKPLTSAEQAFLDQARKGGLKTLAEIENDTKKADTKKTEKWNIYERINFADGRKGNAREIWLGIGTYQFPNNVEYYLGNSDELRTSKEITLTQSTLLVIRGKALQPTLEIYKKEL
jgi:hypothetical protein